MIGTTLSNFRITAKLGEGGMGEVYRAEDTKLGREVAIKVLPESVAEDPERLARFEREAKVLASLNHPNIAGIHQLEEADGKQLLVMELAEGEDLKDRLDRGGIPLSEALPMALQIAQALEAAHESGIIHRDLKPANVMVGENEQIKVLDFGLAKALDVSEMSGTAPDLAKSPLSLSPTLTQQMTGAGVILGTAAYMSPEQAKGKRVDRRADIWAFGVLLWEMLTGQRLFTGESSSEVLAAVLMSEPDLDALPPATPSQVKRLIERCLRRDPSSRLRDIGDARIHLEETLAGVASGEEFAGAEPALRKISRLRTALLVGLGVLVGALATWSLAGRQVPTETQTSDLAIPMPTTLRVYLKPMISPDGRTVAFNAVDIDPSAVDHQNRLYVRNLDSDALAEVDRSKGVSFQAMSPDGKWLVFTAPASELSSRFELLKVPSDLSTPPVKVADFPADDFRQLVWAPSDQIFSIGINGETLISWPASGGAPGSTVAIQSETPVFSANYLTMGPAGQHLLASIASLASGVYRQDVGLIDTETGVLRILVEDGTVSRALPSGQLVFSRRGTLMAAGLDLERLELTSGPVSLMDGLWAEGLWTGGTFDISTRGDLLYPAGEVQGVSNRLAILSHDGVVTSWSDDRLNFNTVMVSPDGKRLATQVDNVAEGDALLQIRMSDVDDPRLTTVGSEPGRDCASAAWSPDSRLLAYDCSGNESTVLYVRDIDSGRASQAVYEVSDPDRFNLIGFAEDGRVLLQRWTGEGRRELVSVPSKAAQEPVEPVLLELEETEWAPGGVSPDGRWLAYISRQTGRRDLFIREVPDGNGIGPRYLVASDISLLAAWSKNATEGGYTVLALQNDTLVTISLQTRPTVRAGQPLDSGIDDVALGAVSFATLSTDSWMIVQTPDTNRGSDELRLVLNWTQRLESRLASAN